jgi:hypothetical protein
MLRTNKTGVFVPYKPLQPSLMFPSKSKALHEVFFSNDSVKY